MGLVDTHEGLATLGAGGLRIDHGKEGWVGGGGGILDPGIELGVVLRHDWIGPLRGTFRTFAAPAE